METSNQNLVFLIVLNFDVLLFLKIKILIIRTENNKDTTPPSLEGKERKIAYANKKYHSGWIWRGAIKGLALLKFSTSPKILGVLETISIITTIKTTSGIKSFKVNKVLNLTLSMFARFPILLEEPFSCNKIRCKITITKIIMGKIKCMEKKRVNVGWEIEGPPQIQFTNSVPTIGTADKTPVITVAPQKDICPQGRTYPKKAVAILKIIIIIPEIHTFGLFPGDEKYIPRLKCKYNIIKNKEAPFACNIRVSQPIGLSRIIDAITSKDISVWAKYIIDNKIPVVTWRVNIIPNINPKFQRYEIIVGEGRSSNDLLNSSKIRLDFFLLFFIILKWRR